MALTMDLQVVLLAPRVFANANYYQNKTKQKQLYCHDFTIYILSNRDVVCYFWHEMNGELKNSNFASCIFGSSRVSGGWLCQQWFCTETGAEISWKGAHLDGDSICTLCNWRQTQGAPDILASRVHWCNNCRKKRPSLWSQTSGPHFLQRLLQAELFKQHSPRQQCLRSSSCGPTVSAIPPGWFHD